MYDDLDWEYTSTATGSFTSTTTGCVGTITLPATGTGYNTTPYVTVTGLGGGGGTTSGSLPQSGSNWGVISVTSSAPQATIVISNEGEIYRGATSKGTGLFERLEKLERMLGILRRERGLEDQYEPLREIGDRYEAACDEAIAKIIDTAAIDLGALARSYENAITQARVYIALTKEPA